MYCSFDFILDIGDKNKGTVYLPSKNSINLPAIVYCHGWKGNRQLNASTKALCEKALSHNIAFVTFDFFGCGETGGDYRDMTYKRWKNNLSDVLTWLNRQPWINREKIGCFSFSSGTTASLRLAQEDHRLSFLISVATCISTNIGMDTGGPSKQFVDHLEDLIAGKSAQLFGIDFPIEFYIDTIGNAPIYKIKDIKCPVYFLQGGADSIYRRSDAKIGYEIMKSHNLASYYNEITNGNHGLDNVSEECATQSIKWLFEIGIISNELGSLSDC